MELREVADATLALAKEFLNELPEPSVDVEVRQRLLWIEQQLNQLLGTLQAICADLEAGCLLTEMGYFDQEELVDMLGTMASQIANLRAISRTLKFTER